MTLSCHSEHSEESLLTRTGFGAAGISRYARNNSTNEKPEYYDLSAAETSSLRLSWDSQVSEPPSTFVVSHDFRHCSHQICRSPRSLSGSRPGPNILHPPSRTRADAHRDPQGLFGSAVPGEDDRRLAICGRQRLRRSKLIFSGSERLLVRATSYQLQCLYIEATVAVSFASKRTRHYVYPSDHVLGIKRERLYL